MYALISVTHTSLLLFLEEEKKNVIIISLAKS
jgi:hypothetical protein